MNITIFKTGTGNAKSAVDYLLSDRDHKKELRSVKPVILRGSATVFPMIANASSRKHKYTSGVIAFRDRENITEEEMQSLIDTFRSVILPGLTADENYSDLWVLHRDKGNIELHFLIANTELTTNRQLNIHPPGKKNIEFFNTFVKVVNHEYGFSQVVPDPFKIALKDFEGKSKKGVETKNQKYELSKIIKNKILSGSIENRKELISFIREKMFEVTRVGEDYITVQFDRLDKNGTRPVRLRGPLFEKNSNYKDIIRQYESLRKPKFLTGTEAKEAKEILNTYIQGRMEFNSVRYQIRQRRTFRRLKNEEQVHTAEHGKKIARVSINKVVGPGIDSILKDTRSSHPAKPETYLQNSAEQNARTDVNSGDYSSAAAGSLEIQIGLLVGKLIEYQFKAASASPTKLGQIRAALAKLQASIASLNEQLQKERMKELEENERRWKLK